MGAPRKSKVSTQWSDNLAYVIGVIATDGNLSPDLRHLCITSKDFEMMENCRNCLGIDNKIGRKGRGDKTLEKNYFALQFGDKNFFDFLLKIGLTPRKSKTIGKLEIPDEYFHHFFRGCIDGDGSIIISRHPESRHPQYRVRLCSASKIFLQWILELSRATFSISGGSITELGKSSVHNLHFGKADSVKILGMIYEGDVVSLSRKRVIAMKILGK